MIKRYTDHAANDRTFLAWVRTAIAVMAFGFLVERFDFFMSTMAGSSSRTLTFRTQQFANEMALAFILLGVAMIVVATIRFFRIAREIDRDEVVHSAGTLFDLVQAALLLLLGLSPAFVCVPSGTIFDLAEESANGVAMSIPRKAFRIDFDHLPHRSASHGRGRIGYGSKQLRPEGDDEPA
jgi:putative membrane protein